MSDTSPWRQVNITFPDWDRAEQIAADRIATFLSADGPASDWWFIRKAPCWRFRYRDAAPGASACLEQHLDNLTTAGDIATWARIVYEPEVHAFGGHEAMTIMHRMFHADSRAILAYLRDQPGGRHRREFSLILCSVMMRAAGLDPSEQGDVWARVAAHRPSPPSATGMPGPVDAVRHLITANAEAELQEGSPFTRHADWAAAYAEAGRELAAVNAVGHLHRGLRDVLAHQVVFAWNRIGLPYRVQSILAATAKSIIFGPDPALETGR
jgi:thiopeptide-type bacteriocin biosynthesis protein